MVGLIMDSVNDRPFQMDQRIQSGPWRGTIKYIGEVPPTKGTWLGVDWDDPKRGKHDGMYNGVRYFQARFATSGSFVRPEKVEAGRSVVDAVKDKYGNQPKVMNDEEKRAIQRAINASLFEFVGFERLNCQTQTMLVLEEQKVSSVGEPGELERLCPLVEDLDLSSNLINSWVTVAEIAYQLTNLKLLNVSDNRLDYSNLNLESLQKSFSNLKGVILSKMCYSWEDILNCAVMWPFVRQLEASFNCITSLEAPTDVLQSLKFLSLEGNELKEWSEIEKLGHLPILEILNLSETGLRRIVYNSAGKLFPSLKYLILNDNNIDNWESVNELDKFPALKELKLQSNPIASMKNFRQIIIARVSKLEIFNGQEIPATERRGCEYDYIKDNAKAWFDSQKDDSLAPGFLSHHPRYAELIKNYGSVDESEVANVSTALKNHLTKVKFEGQDGRVIIKRLTPDMSVQRLASLAERLFSATSDISLTLISSKNPNLRIPLDNGMKSLSFYSVEEGDVIKVSW